MDRLIIHCTLVAERRRKGWRRPATPLLFLVALAACLAGCAGPPAPSGGTATATPATVAAPVGLKTHYVARVRATVLVDWEGYSLYMFRPDDRATVTCTGTCVLTWPPLTLASGSKPRLGKGVRSSLVGTVVDGQGTTVVTYDGWPLYTYTSDIRPGMASGQGIDLNGGPWYLIRPDGQPLSPAGRGSG